MSANRVNIRLARVEDAEMIGAFVRRLTREHVARDFPPQGRRFLQRALGTPRILEGMRGTCRYFVAEERGNMLGVVATRDDHHLLMLFVAEEAQGQGLARALWARAREACLEAGYSGVFTVSAALGAVPVYQRFGFVASGPVTTEHGVTRLPMTTR